uniref:Uncharacterized protein n=1 Tax=Thermus sp. TK10 TaxID=243269 RepID=Q68YB9_9DEIN|nr:hypothetical protein [Thermus sp. TK10]
MGAVGPLLDRIAALWGGCGYPRLLARERLFRRPRWAIHVKSRAITRAAWSSQSHPDQKRYPRPRERERDLAATSARSGGRVDSHSDRTSGHLSASRTYREAR